MTTKWTDSIIYPPPTEKYLFAKKEDVPGEQCPKCGSTDVKRYPIACYIGARIVCKCQNCFHILKMERPSLRDKWPPYRSITYEWEASLAERASRELLRVKEKGESNVKE